MALPMIRPAQHPRTGVYWVRKVVPKGLRQLVGKRELIVSLGTKDPSEAKRLAIPVIADLERRIAAARRGERVEPSAATRREPAVSPSPETDPRFIDPPSAAALPAVAPSKASASTPVSVGEAVRAADLITTWTAEVRPSAATIKKYRNSFAHLARVLGFDDLRRVTEENVVAFKQARLKEGRDPGTVGDDVRACASVCKWAVKNRLLPSNPFVGLAPKEKKGQRPRPREPFSDDDAARILRAARAEDGAMRWLPWLLCFTGARIGEIADLRSKDIREVDGVWIIDIVPHAARDLKTEDSQRMIPVHPALVEEGFLDYVTSVRGHLSGALFPDIPPAPNGARVEPSTTRMYRWIRKRVGITEAEKAPAHSWRHRMEDELRKLRAPEEVVDAITGHHNPRNAGAGYGRGFRKMPDELLKELSRVPSPFGDKTSHPGPFAAIEKGVAVVASPSTNAAPGVAVEAAKPSPVLVEHPAGRRLARLFSEWFDEECDRAYRLVHDPQFAAAIAPPGADRSELLRHSRAISSADALLSLERLQADVSEGDLVAGRAVLKQLMAGAGASWNPPRQALDRVALWIMHGLAAIEEARMRWAEGDIYFRPEPPPASVIR